MSDTGRSSATRLPSAEWSDLESDQHAGGQILPPPASPQQKLIQQVADALLVDSSMTGGLSAEDRIDGTLARIACALADYERGLPRTGDDPDWMRTLAHDHAARMLIRRVMRDLFQSRQFTDDEETRNRIYSIALAEQRHDGNECPMGDECIGDCLEFAWFGVECADEEGAFMDYPDAYSVERWLRALGDVIARKDEHDGLVGS